MQTFIVINNMHIHLARHKAGTVHRDRATHYGHNSGERQHLFKKKEKGTGGEKKQVLKKQTQFGTRTSEVWILFLIA